MATNTAIVNELRAIVGGEFSELKNMLTDISERVRGLEMREAGCSPLMNARVGALERQLTEHDGRLRALETVVTEKAAEKDVKVILSALSEKASDEDFKEHKKDQDKDMKVIVAAIGELKMTNRILTWLGGLSATALVLWLIDRLLSSAVGGG